MNFYTVGSYMWVVCMNVLYHVAAYADSRAGRWVKLV